MSVVTGDAKGYVVTMDYLYQSTTAWGGAVTLVEDNSE